MSKWRKSLEMEIMKVPTGSDSCKVDNKGRVYVAGTYIATLQPGEIFAPGEFLRTLRAEYYRYCRKTSSLKSKGKGKRLEPVSFAEWLSFRKVNMGISGTTK